MTFKLTDTKEGRYVMFVDSNAVLKHKFQQLHRMVVNNVNAASIIDFLFEKKVLGEDDMYRSVIHELTVIEIESEIIYFN